MEHKPVPDAEWDALALRVDRILAGLTPTAQGKPRIPKFKKRYTGTKSTIWKTAALPRKKYWENYSQTHAGKLAQEKADKEEAEKRKEERIQNKKAEERYLQNVLDAKRKAVEVAKQNKLERQAAEREAVKKYRLERKVAEREARKKKRLRERKAAERETAKQERLERKAIKYRAKEEKRRVIKLGWDNEWLRIRDKKIFIARFEGATLREIGEEWGVTTERIRQIWAKIAREIAKLGYRKVQEIIDDNQHKGFPIWNGLFKKIGSHRA